MCYIDDKVLVAKDGIWYVCQWINDYKVRCGKCKRGLIIPRYDKACLVCHAHVLRRKSLTITPIEAYRTGE